MKLRNKIHLFLIALPLLVLGLWLLAMRHEAYNRPELDASRMARIETLMWQAYYTGDKQELARQMYALLHEEFQIPLFRTLLIGHYLGTASFTFSQLNGDYEEKVLPDLENAYKHIKAVTNAKWDPREAARAELVWWVDRRTPGHKSTQQVGSSIADLYILLSGQDNEQIREAAYLRAKAARARDIGKPWDEVERLLKESYETLINGINDAEDTKKGKIT